MQVNGPEGYKLNKGHQLYDPRASESQSKTVTVQGETVLKPKISNAFLLTWATCPTCRAFVPGSTITPVSELTKVPGHFPTLINMYTTEDFLPSSVAARENVPGERVGRL